MGKDGIESATQYGFTINLLSNDHREIQWMEFVEPPHWGAVNVIITGMLEGFEVRGIGYEDELVDKVISLIDQQFDGDWKRAHDYVEGIMDERKNWGKMKMGNREFHYLDKNTGNTFCLPAEEKGKLRFKWIDPFLRVSLPW